MRAAAPREASLAGTTGRSAALWQTPPARLRGGLPRRCHALEQSGDGTAQGVLPLPPPPDLRGKAPRTHWNAAALAFLGDAVWELYARRTEFYPPSRNAAYFERVRSRVRAEAQHGVYEALLAGTFLDEGERQLLRWGRNGAGSSMPKRFAATAAGDSRVYRNASAVETLAGYLYLTDPPRLHQLMAHLGLGDGDDGDGAKAITPSLPAAAALSDGEEPR